jgi:LysR family transcriptional regulator (chromosome initiation inhibitor)
LLDSGALVNLSPGTVLPVNLYWHCWNLNSGVLDALTRALTDAAAKALAPG